VDEDSEDCHRDHGDRDDFEQSGQDPAVHALTVGPPGNPWLGPDRWIWWQDPGDGGQFGPARTRSGESALGQVGQESAQL
jgi:hypothetical protein